MLRKRLFFNNETSFDQNLEPRENENNVADNQNSDTVDTKAIKKEPEVNECLDIKDELINSSSTDNEDSDDDFFTDKSQNSSNCYRLPYTSTEDEEIINFIFKGSNLYKTSSILMWKYLASKKANPKRTYQSLKNRFLRNIKPNLLTVYRHLIPDSETMSKILTKFPELKKNYKNKPLKLPLRATLMFEDRKKLEDDQEKLLELEKKFTVKEPSEGRSNTFPDPTKKIILTKAESNPEETLLVTIYCKLEDENINPKRGIYETYLFHKQMNKTVPCTACGGSGFSNPVGGGNDQTEMISNEKETQRKENDRTPEKIKDSIEKETSKSPSLINTASGNETYCSPDNNTSKNDRAENFDVIPTKKLRKGSERLKKINDESGSCSNLNNIKKEDDDVIYINLRSRKIKEGGKKKDSGRVPVDESLSSATNASNCAFPAKENSQRQTRPKERNNKKLVSTQNSVEVSYSSEILNRSLGTSVEGNENSQFLKNMTAMLLESNKKI